MSQYATLVDLIKARKEEEQKGITFILGDKEERYVSYKQLYLTSLRLLYTLRQSGYRQGDEVLFQIEDNERFVYSFWACILGGMIPVPVSTGNNDEHKLKLFKIWGKLKNPRVIISAEFLNKMEAFAEKNGLSAQMEAVRNSATFIEDAIQTEMYGDICRPDPEDIVLIQFSSGSTGDPKGVIITHGNVLTDLNAVIRWEHIGMNDAGLNWMPLTHDMGLIGTHIKGILACINQFNIQTQLFIRHPSLWIEKASEHKATLLYSPNFGYKHFLKFYNPEAMKEWDLSSVRLIFNGAEPISLDLCNEFLDKMAVYGLKRNAMHPVYGLAEGTIAVAFPNDGEELLFHTLDRNHLRIGETVVDLSNENKNSIVFLDEGYPIYNSFVRICDEENHDIGENRVGCIQISGGNVTSGYYNDIQATKEAITPDGWLKTGDLGFMRNRRLTITGRSKDVIFAAGQNFYSHDIERVCESVDGMELGKIAAAGVFNDRLGCDELILFVMYRQKLESFIPVAASLRNAISRKMGIEATEIIPVKNIPKTTSGKLQRYKLREEYINGEYDFIKQQMHALLEEDFKRREIVPPANPIQEELVKIWSEVLNIERIGIRDNFFDLGGDSLRITQIASRIRDRFQVDLNQAALFENTDIQKLAEVVENAACKRKDTSGEIRTAACLSERAPLSFAQQRLWFLDRLHLQSPQYNLYTGFILKGILNREVLQKSLNSIMKRHKILQSYFIEENGKPVQMLDQEAKMPLKYVDLRNIPEADRRTKAEDLAKMEAGKSFDLEKPPLIRGRLICTGDAEHMLILAVHHIVFDGWSFGILLHDLNLFYEALLNGEEQTLSEPDIQYADFSRWQNENEWPGYLNGQLAYWRKQLEGRLPVLDLPLDNPRPPVQTYNGARFTCGIPAELVNKLQKYARKENATLFMVLLAAFKTLLCRYSGQSDIIVGSPIANRNRKDIEGLIGFFTNNIILRTRFSNKIVFSELLAKVRQVTVEAYTNQDVPFEKLVGELHAERDMSRNPLFQVLFGMQNAPVPKMEFSELNVSILELDAGYSRFDLSVDIRDAGDRLFADFEYNTDLFSEDTISRMAGHYRQLLSCIAYNPNLPLDSYEIMTAGEKKTILYKWNDTKKDINACSNWTELFERQAAASPDAVAAVCGKQQVTYSELDERSNRLAHYLHSAGVGPETVVGVYTDRSIDMLAVLIGIHKTGAAYLPMDPIFPKERLAYIIEDANVGLILSEKKLSGTLPRHNARVVSLDSEWDIISGYSAARIDVNKNSRDLAYVIYTSGSTGKPKGVLIEQHSLINFLLSMAEKTGVKKKDSLLAVTTLSFDIAGLELYMPLICGARVVIAQRDDVSDGSRLERLLHEQGISIMQATPATWRLLIESGWTGCSGLKVLCGGEALSQDLAGQLLDRCSALFNVYGPTETTIWSTIERVESGSGMVSIGRPIANTQVYVVDDSMNPVPAGVPGELLIGGDGLARGYMNLPDLTGEKFIPDRFGKKHGALLYRTGDTVRFIQDGKLEFMGRKDNQVKIRGYRIELGEIENLINQEPSVKESVVAARELIPGEKALVAYIIPSREKGGDISIEHMRKNLADKLPAYMIPSSYMVMDFFPMTPNGKIDRKALPLPQSASIKLGVNYIAPSSEIEKQLVSIWKEVLKTDAVGLNQNFFDSGGHSLLLAQVRSRIGSALKKDVSMMDLFKYPTIAALSGFLSEDGKLAAGTGSAAMTGAGHADTQEGGKMCEKVAVIGLSGRFPGADDIEQFWNNLCSGVESISRFSDEQVSGEGIDADMLRKPGYVKAWGALDGIDRFDAGFFEYNPREAEILDPQQRVFLEESWKALENAGYDVEKFNGLVGVFASVGMNTYAQRLKDSYASNGLASDYQIMVGNDKDFLATRIAYKLNLEGPGITVQTACSSSLVAVHLACRSLISRECDMALAGGVSIRLPQQAGYLYQEGMILSPDGHCRAFDEQAQGTVGGNGAGVVVLKRLDDAISDGDDISAVILGTAVNNDGAMKVGYTAPRIGGQAKAVAKAQAKAGVEPESITYIEAHGTGTPLGDPIEIEALTQVFREKTEKKEYCAIGSVKTNIGHLDAAAGVTGLIKTVLSLRNRMIPPSLNFTKPNPKIKFSESPFYVNRSLTGWSNASGPLRAGVSSFGIGGTNAHAVLEEGPAIKSDENTGRPLLFILSAKSKKALESMTANFIRFLENNSAVNLADVAYTLQLGRKEFEYRRFFVSATVQEALEALRNNAGQQKYDGRQNNKGGSGDYPLEQIGQMWLNGDSIDWVKLYKGQKRKRIPLPVYPFEGQSYWAKKAMPVKMEQPAAMITGRADISGWFYTPVWKQSVESSGSPDPGSFRKGVILILMDRCGFSEAFSVHLKQRYINTVVATTYEEYRQADQHRYLFNPADPAHYDRLIGDLAKKGETPEMIVNMLGIDTDTHEVSAQDGLYFGERLFFSMMYLAQAAGRNAMNTPIQLKVLANRSQKILSGETISPEKALHLGACRVIPREYPNIRCCSIDCVLPETGGIQEQELYDLLADEICFMPCEGLIAYRGMERWKQEYERFSPNEKNRRTVKLKNNGVYIITGGLGGIGLETAGYIANKTHTAIILLGRSWFPDASQWEQWLETHSKKDVISRRIKRLKEIQKTGAELFICRADVSDRDQLRNIRDEVIKRYGKIDGIIHAAGIPGGGMIQLKKKEDAKKVLTPKVKGTLALFDTFVDCRLDFMVFYSSLNAVTGGFGQIDYSAANAFLDAFALVHDSHKGTRFISIDWDRWAGIGMASGILPGMDDKTEDVHPLLGRCLNEREDTVIFLIEISPEKNWVLSEHLVLGIPTVAGTTYLEMARAALEELTGSSKAEITDVLFLYPLAVKPGEKRNVFTFMMKNGNAYDFRIISKAGGEDNENANWLEHIRGKIAPFDNERGGVFTLQDLKEKYGAETIYSDGGQYKLSEEFISFGGRWRSLRSFTCSNDGGLVVVRLEDEFIKDLESCPLHPALLDIATGAVRFAAGGNYLPFSYGNLKIYELLPGTIYCHIKFADRSGLSGEIITCDIDIIGENGARLLEIKDFSMKLVSEASADNFRRRTRSDSKQVEADSVMKLAEQIPQGMKRSVQEGISASEGTEALHRIINGCFRPQIIVSARDMRDAMENADYISRSGLKDAFIEAAVSNDRHPRPELENDYAPPRNETEKKLAELWQDVLGIDKVGIHDEFFALGGDSLLLIQFHTKLKEAVTSEIAVVDLYKYNTIALLAKRIKNECEEEEQPAFEKVNSRVNRQLELMKKRRRQMSGDKGAGSDESY